MSELDLFYVLSRLKCVITLDLCLSGIVLMGQVLLNEHLMFADRWIGRNEPWPPSSADSTPLDLFL